MKTIDQAAQECAEKIEANHVWGRQETQRIQERAAIIAAAMREVCEPLDFTLNTEQHGAVVEKLEARIASLWKEAEDATKQLLTTESEVDRIRLQNLSLIEQRDRLVQTRTPDEQVERLHAEITRLQKIINEYETQWVDEHV